MRIPKELLAACADASRASQVQHVYVDVDTKEAIATNGHILLVLPIEPQEGEVSGYVPREAIEHASKQKGQFRGFLMHYTEYTEIFSTRFPNPYSDAQEDAPKYVEWRSVFPAAPPLPQVALNAQYLLTVAKGLGAPNTAVTLAFDDNNTPISVTAAGRPGRALVMPVRLNKDVPTPVSTPESEAFATMRAELEWLRARNGELQEELSLRSMIIQEQAEELECYKACYGDVFAMTTDDDTTLDTESN